MFLFFYLIFIFFIYSDQQIWKDLNYSINIILNTIILLILVVAAKSTENLEKRYYYTWIFLAVSQFFWVVGDIALMIQNSFSNFYSVNFEFFAYFLRTVCLCVALFLIPRQITDKLTNYKRMVEVAIFLVTISLLLWAFLIRPMIITQTTGSLSFMGPNILLYAVLSFLIINAAIYSGGYFKRIPVSLIVISSIMQVLAGLLFGYYSIANIHPIGIEDTAWITAGILMALAGIYQIEKSPSGAPGSSLSKQFQEQFKFMLPLDIISSSMVASVFLLLIWSYYYYPSVLDIFLIGGTVLVFLLIIRQTLTFKLYQINLKNLKDSKNTYQGLLNTIKDAIYVQTPNGIFLEVNQGASYMYGYSRQEFIGKTLEFLSAPGKNDMKETIKMVKKAFNGESQTFEWWGMRKNGEIFPKDVLLSKGIYFGQEVVVAVARDITQRKQSEKIIRESENMYRAIFENSGAATVIFNSKNGDICMVNSEFESLSGFSREEVEGHLKWMEFVHTDELPMMMEYHQQRAKDPSSVPSKYETRFLTRNGDTLNALITVDKIPDSEKYISSVVDITEQKKQNKALQRELTVNKVMNKLYNPLISKKTSLKEISSILLSELLKLTESSMGFVGEILPDTHDMVLLSLMPPMPYDDREPMLKLDEEGVYDGLMGHALNIKKGFFTNDAPSHPSHMDSHGLGVEKFLAVPVILKGEMVGQVSLSNSSRDYTEKDLGVVVRLTNFYALALQKVRIEKNIRDSLDEKEILLQEIHHRVKNNLQIISSLLSLQSMRVDLDAASDILTDSRNRVQAMAMIHEKLYQSKIFARVSFSEYVEDFLGYLLTNYGFEKGIKVVVDVEDVDIDINTAIPLGLIINEIVTNSLKYAFPDGEGEIYVGMGVDDSCYVLNMWDDGVGLPDSFNIEKSNTMGLQLVIRLANQLNGTLKILEKPGAAFQIRFPLEKE